MASPLSLSPQYELDAWQNEAIAKWNTSRHPERGLRHGIFDIFTGAGKTVVAIGAMIEAAKDVPGLKFAIVVPTQALLDQWVDELANVIAGLERQSIGRCFTGHDDSFATHRFVVYVMNSAQKQLVGDVRGHQVMMVVDECHRAGAEKGRVIFEADTKFRLGLSATAARSDGNDDEGRPLGVELQAHGKGLGPICYALTFKDAARKDLLPPYVIHHHKLALSSKETIAYKKLCLVCSEAESAFRSKGGLGSYMSYVRGRRSATSAQVKAAQEVQRTYLLRKQWLYRVSERNRVARSVLADCARRATEQGRKIRAMLFNERVGAPADPDQGEEDGDAARDEGANALFEGLCKDVDSGALELGGLGRDAVALEHSKLKGPDRKKALRDFREGTVRVLVSVKALTEGIDVPDADVGVSVASTSSARQRIQTMGRLLRYPRDPKTKKRLPAAKVRGQDPKELHLLYVGDSADTRIYLDKDWTEETGKENNRYWRWGYQAEEREADEDPPKPAPAEDEAWNAIKDLPMPQPWPGAATGNRWKFRHDCVVWGNDGPEARSPEEAMRLLSAAAPKLGIDGRGIFTVTPSLGVLLKIRTDPRTQERAHWACGRLTAPLEMGELVEGELLEAPEPVAAPSRGRAGRPARSTPSVAAKEGVSSSQLFAMEQDAIVEELDQAFGGKDAWFDVVKRAFLAVVDSDTATLRACRTVLEKRKSGQAHGILWLNLLESREAEAVEPEFDPGRAFAANIVDAGVRAYVRDQPGVLRRCREALTSRAARTGKPKLAGLASALSILLGETRTISAGGGGEL